MVEFLTIEDAEKYAREGFPVHEVEALSWKQNEEKLKKNEFSKKEFLINNAAPKFAAIRSRSFASSTPVSGWPLTNLCSGRCV